jgi:hypothetical protein
MVDWNQDIGAYLKDESRAFTPFFAIFPNWTPEDYEEVCRRIHDAFAEVGLSFDGHVPRITARDAVAPSPGYRQRLAAETLLFGRYNQDGMFLLPHQKDPSKPRPPWFQDYMLEPGPHSIGQKLIAVSRRRIREKLAGKRKAPATSIEQDEQQIVRATHANHRILSPTESEDTLFVQETASSTSAGHGTSAAGEQVSRSNAGANLTAELKHGDVRPNLCEDLTIHVGNILELDNDQLIMRRTFRDPKTWVKSSAPGIFDFEKVCRSVGVTGGWEKELFFFPDVNKDPHSILDEDELRGGIQYLCTQNSKEGTTRSISFFVAAEIDHVRALSLDQRGKSAFDTISSC